MRMVVCLVIRRQFDSTQGRGKQLTGQYSVEHGRVPVRREKKRKIGRWAGKGCNSTLSCLPTQS